MKVLEGLKYAGICMGIYLFISLIEVFAFLPLINVFNEGFWVHFIIYNVLFIIINPVLTYFIYEKLPIQIAKFNKKQETGLKR